MHKFYLGFHVDKFHLKPKTKKDLDISQKIPTFIKISKNTEQLLYIDVLINPDNFRVAWLRHQTTCLIKVIYRLGEFDNFILILAVFTIFQVK